MPKFKFKSARKNKFNFTEDKEEVLNTQLISGTHTEIFSNKKMIIEGCTGIVEYQSEYLKLKLKKGFINIVGTEFLITNFDEEKITVKGNIASVEFLI